jgi:phosphate acetyltransferase
VVAERSVRVLSFVRGLYVTAFEPGSGKPVVALGLMETLLARAARVGYFRPVAGDGDPQTELVRGRYALEPRCAIAPERAQELIAKGALDEVEKAVVATYRELSSECDIVVCEGVDLDPATPGLDVDIDTRLANALGCPVVAIVTASAPEGAAEATRVARESLDRRGCEVLGIVVSGVPGERAAEVSEAVADLDGAPVYVVPEPEELTRPTIAEVAEGLDATVVGGAADDLDRPVRAVRIGAMSVEHFVDDLEDGTLVIVPGDRADILVASLASGLSPAVPAVAGILLTAGYEPAEPVRRLLEQAPFPVLSTPERTFAAAMAVNELRPRLRPGDERRIASALGAFGSGVDPIELGERIAIERPARMTPVMFEFELLERAQEDRRHVVLPEGDDDRVLQAADILLRRGAVQLTILGNPDEVSARAAALGLDLSEARLVDPETSPLREQFAKRYFDIRKHRGMTEEGAFETVADVSYFGTLMVLDDEADGMVSGAAHTTGDTIRPAFEAIKARPGVSVISSVFLMCLPDRVLVYGDCAVNPKPSTEQLADIAIGSSETAWSFGVEPRVAMLSYSTGDSARGPHVTMVREATDIVRERRPDIPVEGPIQYDAAIEPAVAEKKLPGSEVAGRATVFIFPDLETGNIAYKAVQRSSGAVAIGPVLQGLRKPVNDLSRGCTVPDIVSTVVITAIQAQEVSGRSTSRLQVRVPPAGQAGFTLS